MSAAEVGAGGVAVPLLVRVAEVGVGAVEVFGQVPAPLVRQRADEALEGPRGGVGGGVLLQLGGPAAHEVALDALERIVGVGQVPLLVLRRHVGVARRRLGAQLALVLAVVVLGEVVVDVVDHVELLVANGADEELLVVGGGGRRLAVVLAAIGLTHVEHGVVLRVRLVMAALVRTGVGFVAGGRRRLSVPRVGRVRVGRLGAGAGARSPLHQRWVIAIETEIRLLSTLPIILNCVIGIIY